MSTSKLAGSLTWLAGLYLLSVRGLGFLTHGSLHRFAWVPQDKAAGFPQGEWCKRVRWKLQGLLCLSLRSHASFLFYLLVTHISPTGVRGVLHKNMAIIRQKSYERPSWRLASVAFPLNHSADTSHRKKRTGKSLGVVILSHLHGIKGLRQSSSYLGDLEVIWGREFYECKFDRQLPIPQVGKESYDELATFWSGMIMKTRMTANNLWALWHTSFYLNLTLSCPIKYGKMS